MRIWIISPNVSGELYEQPLWEKAILNNEVALMGWDEDHSIGAKFINEIQKGDFILIAQGANRQKRLFIGGLVMSDAVWDKVDGSPREAYCRRLGTVLSKIELEALSLDFNGTAYGAADRIPALYVLHPSKNNADKKLVDKINAAILKKAKTMELSKIIKLIKYKKQIILQGPPGTGKTRAAKELASQLVFEDSPSLNATSRGIASNLLEHSDQFKLIQFHPAYSYEDFVRGITTQTVGTAIEYVARDKVLGAFAREAQQNYLNSQKTTEALSKEQWLDKAFEAFTDMVENEIIQNGSFKVNKTVSINEVEEDAFRYGSVNWNLVAKQRMKFSDLKTEYLAGVQSRQDIKKLQNISGRAKQHSSYDFMMVEKLVEFLTTQPPYQPGTPITEPLRIYVLVIDEINRANLPAVFGELIYALEYRGQKVSSLYDIGGDNTLVLPPNLYIIGTMNTADRSVGHIDYALRRRFAFKSILPNPEPVHLTAKLLFQKVSELFVKDYSTIDWSAEHPKLDPSPHLAPDFKPEDVWIGHSYFIAEDTPEHTVLEQLELKRTFELMPLLQEYLKDGILLSTAQPLIEEIGTLAIF